jgi:hypothetical protein
MDGTEFLILDFPMIADFRVTIAKPVGDKTGHLVRTVQERLKN